MLIDYFQAYEIQWGDGVDLIGRLQENSHSRFLSLSLNTLRNYDNTCIRPVSP
jgi:hypothetical protein